MSYTKAFALKEVENRHSGGCQDAVESGWREEGQGMAGQ